MKKLNKKERELWDICANYTMSKSPSANEVWMRLEQQLNNVDQVKAKKLYDPKGILNPGKLRGWSN